MKYLHIIGTGHPVAKSFPDFICENFSAKDHDFLIIGDKVSRDELPEHATLIKAYDHKTVLQKIKASQFVFIHGLSISTRTKVSLLRKKYLKRIVWVAWGADLYQNNYSGSFFRRLKGRVDTAFKKRISNFVGIFPPDIDYFKAHFNTGAKTFFAKYAAGKETANPIFQSPAVVRTIRERLDRSETINIIIGHQSNPLLEHKQVIDWLVRFKDENIHVFVPLSYGDATYAKEAGAYAEQMLGEKVTVLRDFMSQQAYMDLLQDMDIAIFHIDRQIGLGNIYPLMYMQKKLYLKSSGAMYGHFKTDGIEIQASEALQDITFCEFLQDVDMSAATDYITALQDKQANIQRWSIVFDALRP